MLIEQGLKERVMKLSMIVGLAAGWGTALVGSAGCGGEDPTSSSALPAPVNGVYSLQIQVSTPSSLPKCTSALSGTVAYVSSPADLWACSGGSWCEIKCSSSSAGDVAYSSSPQTLVACVSNAWTAVALPQGPKGPQGDAGPPGPQGPQGPQGVAGATGPTGATGLTGVQGAQGTQGLAGATGAPGITGATGPQGPQGDAGAVSLVLQTAAPATDCSNGGTEIQSGLDLNGDKQLESTEVTSISYVCNGATGEAGAQGAPGSQVQVTAEPPGSNCASGGERIDVGEVVDGGFDIQRTAYVCNGGPGGTADAEAGVPLPDGATVADSGASAQWVMGYYVGYSINSYPIASIDWTGLTHIIFGPMTVNSDLSLNLSFDDENGTGQTDAVALAQAAHANGVKALLMLGGAGAGANIATAANAANRAGFVTALVGVVNSLGYDGVDLDWEDSVNLDDLVSLAQALRAANPMLVLTYPAATINSNIQTVDPRMATLAQSLDRFNVQTYYPSTAEAESGWDSWFNSPVSGMTITTPIAIDDTLARYATAGIPRAKLGMGVGFFAICYTGGINGPRQPIEDGMAIVGGDGQYPLSVFFAAETLSTRARAPSRCATRSLKCHT